MTDTIQRAIVRLIWDNHNLASLLLGMERVADPSMNAIAAVGFERGALQLRCHPLRFAELPLEQAVGVLEHEALHVVQLHLLRRPERDALVLLGDQPVSLWNIACDLAINQFIRYPLPPTPLLPEQFGLPARRSAEEYYDRLLARRDPDDWTLPGAPVGADLVDDHDGWQAGGIDPDDQVALQTIREAVARAFGATRRGCAAGRGSQPVAALHAPPELPWAALLRGYVASAARADRVRTSKRESRRFEPPHPGERRVPRLRLVVALDTSGSINLPWLERFVAEVHHIQDSQPLDLWIAEADAAVQRLEHLGRRRLSPELRGRGGTDFCPIFEVLEARRVQPDLLVYLTDLNGRFPARRPHYPVIWVAVPQRRPLSAPFGRVIRLHERSGVSP